MALEFIKDAVYNFSPRGAGHKHGKLSPVQAFLSGGISRGIAAAVTCPVTVVKTRMEYVSASSIKYKVNDHESMTPNLYWQASHHATDCARYRVVQGTVHALRTIAASEGASGLMRGFWPTVLSNAPFSAIYYMLYSDLRQRFHKVLLTNIAEHVQPQTVLP